MCPAICEVENKKNYIRYQTASRAFKTVEPTIVPQCPHCGGQHEYAVSYRYAQSHGVFIREGLWRVELHCKAKPTDPGELQQKFYWKCTVKETKIR